ncbi:MAG: DUF1385 domain-containing protein [Christensenellaceae bacterium]|nr:DUF1385 domain-containing protein [Christensenellaceae bacterium]
MKSCNIGGQGVLEGVMMRSPEYSALAVHKADGSIVTKKWKNPKKNEKWKKIPVVRGVVNLVEMLYSGTGVISDSAKMFDETFEEEPSKLEKYIAKKTGKNAMDIMMVFAVFFAIILSVGLFFILPTFLASFFRKFIPSELVNSLLEGLIRVIILIGYMIFCTCVKDVRRVFMYHGAEHKTISCYENEEELTVENVRKHRRLHPRCGTSYMLLVMIVSILIYAILGELGLNKIHWSVKYLSKIIVIPLIAGIAYEILKGAAKHENWFTRAIRWPGMQLQRLTTKEPDDSMLEIGIIAFEMALEEKSEKEIAELIAKFDRSEKTEVLAEDSPAEETPAEPAEEKAE